MRYVDLSVEAMQELGLKGEALTPLDCSYHAICWNKISGDVRKLGTANVSSEMVAGVVLPLHCAHVFRLRGDKQVLHTLCTIPVRSVKIWAAAWMTEV